MPFIKGAMERAETNVKFVLEKNGKNIKKKMLKSVKKQTRGTMKKIVRKLEKQRKIGMEDEGFKKSWALENLQPMWAEENIKKGNRFAG